MIYINLRYLKLEKGLSIYSLSLLEGTIRTLKEHHPISVNAGIIGGKNFDFFKLLYKEAFDFIDKKLPYFSDIKVGDINIIYEQLFLSFNKARKNYNKSIIKKGFKRFC